MSDTTSSHWLGECTGDTIVGLFNPDLNAPIGAPAAFSPGDIIQVNSGQSLFAAKDSALNQILRVLARYDLDPSHPQHVIDEAEAFRNIDFLTDANPIDLTHLPFVTIDNPDSRDLDQAVFVSRDQTGFEVNYALADASWFVPAGTALFDEALVRGVTYYAPDYSVRMLPAVLSEDLVSLNESVERRAMVFQIKLSLTGTVINTRVERAIIRSRAKLSYGQVQQWYDQNALESPSSRSTMEWSDSLLAMRSVGELRIADARRRDVIEFNRREAQVTIDPANQNKLIIVVRERNDAEKYNEQISLLCNIEGARLLQSSQPQNEDLQPVYRVHQPPMAIRMEDFRGTLTKLTHHHQLDDRFQWQSDESLADYIAKLPADTEFAALRQTIERMAMLTNRASTFESEPDQHYALGVDAYARFSSPMREVVGIFTHKELYESLGLSPAEQTQEDAELRARVIEKANDAKKLQRKLEKEFQLLALHSFLDTDLKTPEPSRAWHPAVIVGMRTNRLYLHLEGLALEIKIYLEDLNQHYQCIYQIEDIRAVARSAEDDKAYTQAPVLTMGDQLTVQVSSLDTARRRYLFKLRYSR